MSKTLRIATLAASLALALPAVAGPSWPPTPPRKTSVNAPAGEKEIATQNEAALPAAAPGRTRTIDGFEVVAGESGWQLASHKYDFVNGQFAMSDECDHAIRAAQRAPTPAELDEARRLGGA